MDQREKFETWAKSKGLIQESHGCRSESSHSATGWEAWQAALAASAPVARLTDRQIIEIAVTTHSAEANKDGGYILPISFARAIEARSGVNAQLVEALKGAVAQMEMAAGCVENGRNDEALLHLRSMMSPKKAALAAAGVEVTS